MHQKDNIEALARELDIDYGTSSQQLDRMNKIAEAVGMDHYNGISNADTDELERRLKEKIKQRDAELAADNEAQDDKEHGDIINLMKDGLSGAFKKAPLKVKLIIIGVIAAFIMIMFFIVTIVASLMSIGIIDINGMGGPSGDISFGYSSILDSSDFWWPIGSRSVDANGFASGKPSWTTITSNFGPRTHPITGVVNSFHTGVDIADGNAAGTTNVIASRSGRVVYPSISDRIDCPTSNALDGCGGGYGNYVLIDHGGGVSTLYAHLHYMTINVTAGDYVSQGEVIGKIGSSGNSTGPHLHFEVRHNGSAVEPLNYISMSNPRP